MTRDHRNSVENRKFNKIFGIGLNKTGTTSLHFALEALGFRSLHHAPNRDASMTEHIATAQAMVKEMEAAKEKGTPILAGYEDYDAFLDIGPVIKYFEIVDRQYPGSKFIYTFRDMDAWIDSRIRHVERNRMNREKGLYPGKFLEIEPDKWKQDRARFEKRVRRYFRNRPADLLEMNITDGDGWEKLCPFLGLPVREDPFPWENKIPSSVMPNFFILGAAKCGTTSLYNYLKEHPDIFMAPVKEPCFFCKEFQIVKNPVAYARLFAGAKNASWVGEASHVYFSSPSSARTLRTFVPNAKFILILRHPADRAYSLYHHMRRYGYETTGTFEKALAAEDRRADSEFFKRHCNQYFYNFLYFRSGLFGEQVERYFRWFPRERFHILTLDQLMGNPAAAVQGILDFLGLRTGPDFQPDLRIFNKGRTSRRPLLANFLNRKIRKPGWLRRAGLRFNEHYNGAEIPPVNPETRRRLCARYHDDLLKLRDLTGVYLED